MTESGQPVGFKTKKENLDEIVPVKKENESNVVRISLGKNRGFMGFVVERNYIIELKEPLSEEQIAKFIKNPDEFEEKIAGIRKAYYGTIPENFEAEIKNFIEDLKNAKNSNYKAEVSLLKEGEKEDLLHKKRHVYELK